MEASVDPSITTVTVFTFPPRARAWAFAQMGLARPLLANVPGLRFHRMMGCGRGQGFTLNPDWSRYVLFAVWDSEADAGAFLEHSPFMRRYLERAERAATARVRPLVAHGTWDGESPFGTRLDRRAHPTAPPTGLEGGSPPIEGRPPLIDGRPPPIEGRPPLIDGPMAVLTRATIRLSRLTAFWGMVPRMSGALDEGVEGLIASIGIGEMPFYRQATFSVWESLEAMKRFAYASPLHREAMQRTRKEGWYSEDLFARFAILKLDTPFP